MATVGISANTSYVLFHNAYLMGQFDNISPKNLG